MTRTGVELRALPDRSIIGTSSPRRECLIRSLRPDARVAPIRGNVERRVQQLDEGRFDAIVLAVAGLTRLGLDDRISERLDPHAFPPAPGQGALAVQVRPGEDHLEAVVRGLDDPGARATSSAERACLEALGGGCSRPIGVHAWQGDGGLGVVAVVGTLDGSRTLRAEASGTLAEEAGRAAAASLLEAGAADLLA